MNQPKIAVIGAGITGLTLGRLLPGSVVYEKSSFIGGPSRTLHYKDFHFDIGLHWLPHLSTEAETFLNPFMGNGVSKVSTSGEKITWFKNNHRLREIYHPLDFPFEENPLLALNFAASYYWRQVFPKNGNSLESHLINSRGDCYYKLFSRDFVHKFLGVPPDQISLPELPPKERESFLQRLIRWIRRGGRRLPLPKINLEVPYPLPWFGVIVDKLAEGLEIRRSSALTKIHLSGQKVTGIEINHREKISCEHLILTLPPHSFVPLLNPPQEVLQAAQGIRYRDLIYAVLFFDAEQVMEESLVIALGKEIFARAIEPKNWSKQTAPPHQTSVCFEIPCFEGDSLWLSPDPAILKKVSEDFRSYYSVPEPFDGIVIRIPRFRPIFDQNLAAHLKILRGFASSLKNIYFPSDNLFLQGTNINTAVTEALRIAKEVQITSQPEEISNAAAPLTDRIY